MKSRDGFAAEILVFLILALVVIGGIAYVHYVYLPRMAAQNSSSSSVPHIDSLSPSFDLAQSQGGKGTPDTVLAPAVQVTIHGSGFTPTSNTVNFIYGPVNNLSSTDGQTITFNFSRSAAALAQCTGTPMEAAFCEDMSVGVYPISVSNANGASNEASFNVTSTPSSGGTPTQKTTNTTPSSMSQNISNSQTNPTPAAFSCSYSGATNVGIIIHASFPSYIDPSIVEVPYSGGNNAIISKDLSQNLFCVKARKASVDELFFGENKPNGAGLLTFVVNPVKGQQYTVDANSSAIGFIFMDPYFFNSNPASAQVILAAIAKDPNISTFAQFIQTTPDFASQLKTNTQMTTLVQTMAVSIMKALTATSTTTTAAAIQITAPAGNDTWSASASTQQTITWKSQGVDSNAQAQIYLYFPDGSQCNIGTSPVGDGVFNVILPSMGCAGSTQKPNLVPGGYSIAIVVEGANNTVVTAGQSAWFNITQ